MLVDREGGLKVADLGSADAPFLREDAALFPDTMDQRYGAWAQLLVLFRMIYDGAESGALRLPERHGVLFDPDRFPYVERAAKPGVLNKATAFALRLDVDVRPEPTPINLRRTPLELAQVVYGATGQ